MADWRTKYGIGATPKAQPVQPVTQTDWRVRYGLTATPAVSVAPRVQTLPAFVGGGQVDRNAPFPRPQADRSYGGLEAVAGRERDHTVPFSLGGTNTRENVVSRPLSYVTARDKYIGKLADDVRAGRLSREEAITKALRVYNEQDTKASYGGAVGAGAEGIVNFLKEVLPIPKPASGASTVPTAKSMNFPVGEGLTPEQQATAQAVVRKPAPPTLPQQAAQYLEPQPGKVRLLDFVRELPGAVYQTGKQIVRQLANVGPRVALTAAEALTGKPGIVKPQGKVGELMLGKAPVVSYQQELKQKAEEYTKLGFSNTGAHLLAFTEVGSGAILDVAGLGAIVESGAKAVLKGVAPKVEQVEAARTAMGLPENWTQAERQSAYLKAAKELHPDRPNVSSDQPFKRLNEANTILKASSPVSAVDRALYKVTKPLLSEPGAFTKPGAPYVATRGLLPEQAGMRPAQPFNPIRPAPAGLSTREVSLRPNEEPGATPGATPGAIQPNVPQVPENVPGAITRPAGAILAQPSKILSQVGKQYTVGSIKTAEAIANSTNQQLIARVGETPIELGSYGRNTALRKTDQNYVDRFPASELQATLKNVQTVTRASDNPTSYRYDNKAWIAKMPNGEARVVYTRPRANGSEEVINWHKVNETKNPNFIKTLEAFGSPTGTRTPIGPLEPGTPSPLADRAISSVAQPDKIVKVPLGSIDTGLLPQVQAGAKLDSVKIQELMAAVRSGAQLPPVPVYEQGGRFVLNQDGFHRYAAYKNLGLTEVPVRIEPRTELSASAKQKLETTLNLGVPKTIEAITEKIKSLYRAKAAQYEQAMYQILVEMEVARPGRRVLGMTPEGVRFNVPTPSTFPDWVPERLRSTKLFRQVLGGFSGTIDDIAFPPASKPKLRELYQEVFDRIDQKLDVNTKPLRIKLYDTTPEKASSRPAGSPGLGAAPTQLSSAAQTSSLGPKVPFETGSELSNGLAPEQANKSEVLQRINGLLKGRVTTPRQAEFDFGEYQSIMDELPPQPYVDVGDASSLQDITQTQKGLRDVYRNFKQVFGDQNPVVQKTILNPFDDSKGRFVDMQKELLDELNKNIIQKYGIKPKSEESAYLQLFGEQVKDQNGRLVVDRATLEKKFGKAKADDIEAADRWFRAKYEKHLDQVNEVRKQIYPNNPGKQIPHRSNYYRHFRDLSSDLSNFMSLFETPAGIDPRLSGLSTFTKPKTKWLSFAQQRKGNITEYDAVGGYLNYVPSAAYAVHIDPHVNRFRGLAKQLANQTIDTKNVNNFIDFLQKFSNSLAGKSSELDRIINDWIPGGRKLVRALNWLNSRIKANTILANASSSLAQIFNVPQGIASAKQYSVPAAGDTLLDLFVEDRPIQASTFIKERYHRTMYDKFDPSILKYPKKYAAWFTGILDEVGTRYIWNAHYRKAVAQGIPDPVRYADQTTRSLVAGRGVGEVPLLQQARVFQLIAPFQLEVQNLWWVMQDFVRARDFGAIVALFISAYLFNRGAEKVRGSGVMLDPIQAFIEAYQTFEDQEDKRQGALLAAGRLAGEVVSNVPFGQTLASIYPEYGTTIGNTKLPTRKELFGREDPTRFGTGILAFKGLQDPLFRVLPPFGGVQLEKTLQGIKVAAAGQVKNKAGVVQYKLPEGPMSRVRTAVFGPGATPQSSRVTPEAIYQQINKLPTAEAEAALDALSDADYKLYLRGKEVTQNRTAKQSFRTGSDIVKQVQKLLASGDEAGVDELLNNLTEAQYRAYKAAKKQMDVSF